MIQTDAIQLFDSEYYLDLCYKKCTVELWDFSHSTDTQQNIIDTVATVASISRNEVSNDSNKLFNILLKARHLSPFEFIRQGTKEKCTIAFSYRNTMFQPYHFDDYNKYISTVKVSGPIYMFRQLMRHRNFSYMELSGRYCYMGDEVYIPPPIEDNKELYSSVTEHYFNTVGIYNHLVNKGISKEIARTILPLSLISKTWIISDFISFRSFVLERLSIYAQKEIRQFTRHWLYLLCKYQSEFEGLIFYDIHGNKVNLCNKLFDNKNNADETIDISKTLELTTSNILNKYNYNILFDGENKLFSKSQIGKTL